MSEEELRKEAVRRRLAGESPTEIAAVLGRTSRWVRKWLARHDEVAMLPIRRRTRSTAIGPLSVGEVDVPPRTSVDSAGGSPT